MRKMLLNDRESGPVTAPAFALTKVWSLAVVLVPAITAPVLKLVDEDAFTSDQAITLVPAVLFFLAVVIAADVLARALAVLGDAQKPVVTLSTPIDGWVGQEVQAEKVHIVAWSKDKFLCVSGCSGTRPLWLPINDIAIKGR